MIGRILVVDDEPLKRITLQIELSEQGYEVHEAADAETARQVLEQHAIDVVVSDVRMPGQSGLDLLTFVKQTRPHIEVVLMTAYATIDTAVLAIKRGAYDYITKPFTTPELLQKLDRLFASREASGTDGDVEFCGRLVGRCAAIKRLFAQVRNLANTDYPVLLTGASGTGKDLLAEALHALGPRAERALVRFSAGSVPPEQHEAELFGPEPAPGAARARVGRCEAAEAGTLVIDELEALSPAAQARLLRLIERGEYECAGAARPASARLVCMTRADLAALVQAGQFRADLFYRLEAVRLALPPLCERTEDVPILARHFLGRHAQLVGAEHVLLTPHAIDELLRHNWPGNVRELEQVIERALAFSDGNELRAEHVLPLTAASAQAASAGPETAETDQLSLTATVAEIERRMVLFALRQCEFNQARAAQRLGIPRTTLRDKMAKYAIPTS